MVDDRRASILQAVVQHYIETSQPVSSAYVADADEIHASSATVRTEMASLERDGYLMQPHTSAGRIPTDLGYRFFVDEFCEPTTLEAAQQQSVGEFFAESTGEIERMLHETGRLLSELTSHAAVVVGPDQDGADQLFVGGTSRIAAEFDAIDTVRSVLTILEKQYVVATLMHDLLERGISVSIGTENGLQSLAQCSLVLAPMVVDGEMCGSIAVLGPTRMNYSQAMAAVAVVSRRLDERLAETRS